MKYVIGDVVTGEHDGYARAMTVEKDTDEHGQTACVWFVGNEVRRESFHVDTLVKMLATVPS